MYNVIYDCNFLCERLPNEFFFFLDNSFFFYFDDSVDETCVNLWYSYEICSKNLLSIFFSA